jgi:hypothetical protein
VARPPKPSRRVWIHRGVALACLALTPPAVIWWRDSVLFVIVVSLATQIYAALSASEAADDTAVTERLDRIEQLLRHDRSGQ